MVMLGSQLMSPMLCQVISYPHLKEDEELIVGYISSTITCGPHIEDALDDVSSYDVDID